jgi:hypothetical protein
MSPITSPHAGERPSSSGPKTAAKPPKASTQANVAVDSSSKRWFSHSALLIQVNIQESPRWPIQSTQLPQKHVLIIGWLAAQPPGSPWGTWVFFVSFAAVALYGPAAKYFQEQMHLGGLALGLLVAAPQPA